MAFADNIAQFINRFISDVTEAVWGIVTALVATVAAWFSTTPDTQHW